MAEPVREPSEEKQEQQEQEILPAPVVTSQNHPQADDAEIIEGRPVNPPQTQARAIAYYGEYHSGPLPPPHVLAGYESVSPGLADRIVKMAEKQQDHRMELEARVVHSNTQRSSQGLVTGGIVSGLTIAAACYFAYLGQAGWGAGLCGATLVSLVTVFVTGKSSQKKELAEKAQAVPEIEGSKNPQIEDKTGKQKTPATTPQPTRPQRRRNK